MTYRYRLLHGIFPIIPFISPRSWYMNQGWQRVLYAKWHVMICVSYPECYYMSSVNVRKFTSWISGKLCLQTRRIQLFYKIFAQKSINYWTRADKGYYMQNDMLWYVYHIYFNRGNNWFVPKCKLVILARIKYMYIVIELPISLLWYWKWLKNVHLLDLYVKTIIFLFYNYIHVFNSGQND
jgi:hypothetical protein